jgi:NAD(P)-dependent dehydrogenase (short-subunit alcohol dehydrogenase family)
MGSLTNKVALVTGAGQGIGRGIGLALLAEGAKVAVLDIDAQRAEQTVATMRARGGEAIAVVCDVCRPEQIGPAVESVVNAFGGLQILVNNAQSFPIGPLLQVSDEAAETGWLSGPMAVLRFMRACHPHLCGGGVIVNVSSPAASSPQPVGLGAYAGVKAATQALTRTAALEWASQGIRVLAIQPVANSPQVEQLLLDPVQGPALLSQFPLGRVGDCERDIGRVVAFLCGPDASYMTGVVIPLDGGYTYLR